MTTDQKAKLDEERMSIQELAHEIISRFTSGSLFEYEIVTLLETYFEESIENVKKERQIAVEQTHRADENKAWALRVEAEIAELRTAMKGI
jgi:hypothetical protein